MALLIVIGNIDIISKWYTKRSGGKFLDEHFGTDEAPTPDSTASAGTPGRPAEDDPPPA